MTFNFFNVIIKEQTYLNLIYLLLAFPLGIFYFVFLTTGLSLGIGLAITLIGIPLLALMTVAWYGLGLFERIVSMGLLDLKIDSMSNNALREKTIWKKLSKHLSNSATWKSLGYLFIKFPLGILSFVLLVTLLSVSLSLIATPIVYYFSIIFPNFNFMVINGIQIINGYGSAFVFSIIGILLLFISLHILNGLAYLSGLLAQGLLSGSGKKSRVVKKRKKK